MANRDEIPKEEFSGRLLFSLAQPVARLGVHLGLSLKQVERIVRMAYFRAAKSTGASNQEVAQRLGVSVPTVARLARTTRENFLQPNIEHQLPQRIEFMLWAEPMSLAKIQQILGDHDASEIEQALEKMESENRIVRRDDSRYELGRYQGRLVRSHWIARIGSLNSLLDNLTRTVKQRFLTDKQEKGFARTLNFSVAPEDVEKLNNLYELVIWPALVALEEKALQNENAVEIKMSLFWDVGENVRNKNNNEEKQ